MADVAFGGMSVGPAPSTTAPMRLGVVLLLEFVALFCLPRLAVWRGVEREVWQVLLFGGGAAVCVVLLAPVLWRGSGLQRLWAVLLAGLPLFLLYWAGVEIVRLGARP